MQKLQILFPDPLMDALRRLAKAEDRPVSEIVRRAVDRDLEQRAGLLRKGTNNAPVPVFPNFSGGKVLVSAADMKTAIYDEDT
jgi:hypothetical protein